MSALPARSRHFEIMPRGPFSLEAGARFLSGFEPFTGTANAPDGHVHLAFVLDGSDNAVGVCLQSAGDTVTGEVSGIADPEVVRAQVARIFSLDVDGSGYPEIGRRDPAIGRVQAQYPGLRPVTFYSPYEAGAWALISHRIQMTQAARIKARMSEELGEAVEIHGDLLHAFPSSARLLELTTFRGLFGRKVEYLHGLAVAALDGRLDAERLRRLPPAEALAELKGIPGIGDFSAGLILLRGAGVADGPPSAERRLLSAVALAYGLDTPPSERQLEELAERWRPYRTWVTFLLRVMIADEERLRRS